MAYRTEDEVRNAAGGILGFTVTGPGGSIINIENTEIISGVGQLTTFIELGKRLKITEFRGISNKPDGWYFPKDTGKPASILETKSEKEDLSQQKWKEELLKNIEIVLRRYHKVIGILYNGKDIRVFKGKMEIDCIAPDLQNKE